MAKEDVNIKVSANVAEAIQLWKAMEAGPDGMAKSLAAMGDKGTKATKGLSDELTAYVGKWATAGAAIATVTAEIHRQTQAVRELREAKLAATTSVDEVWTQFQVQSGLQPGAESDRVRSQLFQTIGARKAAPISGMQAAVALGSAGASVQDITGGGLDEFLQLVTASNAAGKEVNQGELASSLVKFLKANNLQPNRAGMQGTSLAIQQLFGGTNLQASNLSRFARDAGSISSMSHMAPEDQLAQYSMLLDTMSEDTASTAFKSGVMSLSTAGGDTTKKRALAMLGLKPGDVDYQGEGWQDVNARLTKGFSGIAPDKRNVAAKMLFGDEGLPFYTTFLEDGDLAEAQRRGGMARSSEGALQRLQTAESSMAAGARQAETAATAYMYDKSMLDPDVVRNRLRGLAGQLNLDESTNAYLESEFQEGGGIGSLYGLLDDPMESRIKRTARAFDRYSGIPQGGTLWGKPTTHIGAEEAEATLRGQRHISIQIKGPDGLDVPHEPAAADLNDWQRDMQRQLGW